MPDRLDLKHISTFHDAVNQLWSVEALTVEQYEQLSGFGLLPGNRKQELVGVPFLIIKFEFKPGKNDSSFVECYIITTNDERHIIRDSSRGIHEQLRQILQERATNGNPSPGMGVWIAKGLTFKDNPYRTATGEQTTSRTFYLT